MRKNPLFPRLLKKVQMQGGVPGTHPQDGCRCEAYLVCTSQRRASPPTPQMGLFQQPAKTNRPTPKKGTAGQRDFSAASLVQSTVHDPGPLSPEPGTAIG